MPVFEKSKSELKNLNKKYNKCTNEKQYRIWHGKTIT